MDEKRREAQEAEADLTARPLVDMEKSEVN